MKKNILIFILLFIAVIYSHAQDIQKKFKLGMSLGVTLNSVNQDLSDRVYSEYSGDEGIYTHLSGEYRFYGPFYLTSGVSFLKKNYKFERTGNEYGGIHTEHKTEYLNVPVLAGLYIFNSDKDGGLKVQLGGGGYIGYWLGLKRSGVYPSHSGLNQNAEGISTLDFFPPVSINDQRYDFDKNENNYHRFDYGLQGELKVLYGITDVIDVSLGYSLLYGLSRLQKEERNQSTFYHTSHIIQAGVAYKFGFNKKESIPKKETEFTKL